MSQLSYSLRSLSLRNPVPSGVPALSPALDALARGEAVALLDERQDQADFVAAADLITGRTINFMATHGRGLTSLALPATRVDELRLPPMSAGWERSRHGATISIEAREGVTTGISAPDRARTIRVAVSDGAKAFDIVSPGHVFPLRVEESSLARPRTRGEVALSLLHFAGRGQGAVLCEILDDAGERARQEAVAHLAQRWSLCLVSHQEVREALAATGRR